MKKLINSPENVVSESMSGLAAAYGDLIKIHLDPNYIVRKDAPVKNKEIGRASCRERVCLYV